MTPTQRLTREQIEALVPNDELGPATVRALCDTALAAMSERDALRVALCGLMGIDGSPESLEAMRVGIVMNAGTAPDPMAAEHAMRCVDALAALSYDEARDG